MFAATKSKRLDLDGKHGWKCSAMFGTSLQKHLSFLQKLSGLFNCSGGFFLADHGLKAVVGLESPVISVQQKPVIFGVHDSGLGEMLSKEGVNAPVFSGAETFLAQQSLGSIKHRVVGPSRSKIRVAVLKQRPCRLNCASSLFQQLAGVCVQAGIDSSRTLARKKPPAFRHSSSVTKTRLTLIP